MAGGSMRASWALPALTVQAVQFQAGREHRGVSDWVETAFRAWVRGVEAGWPVSPAAPVPPALPDRTVTELQFLALDPNPTRLSVWLWLLQQARWPVSAVVGPLLGIDEAAVMQKVAAGKQRTSRAGIAELMAGLPPVPTPPDDVVVVDKVQNARLAVTLPRVVRDDLYQAAKALGLQPARAALEAIIAALARSGIDPVGQPLEHRAEVTATL